MSRAYATSNGALAVVQNDLTVRALRHHQAGRVNEAMHLYRHILVADPQNDGALHLLGVIALQGGQNNVAVELIVKALLINSSPAFYYSNLGSVLKELRRPDDAIIAHCTALSIEPDYAPGHYNYGNVLAELGQVNAAFAAYCRALQIKRDYADAHTNLGITLYDLGRLDAAVVAQKAALGLKPDHAEAHYNHGIAINNLGHTDAAVASYRKALSIKPDYADAHCSLGLALLLSGNFKEGWQEYQWRGKKREIATFNRDFGKPLWQGERLGGKTILLHAEQGIGDTIQFCRYAPFVSAQGGRVVLQVHRPLMRFLGGLAGTERIVDRDDPLQPFDVHCPLMGLPQIFGTNVENIPAAIPYLAAEPDRVAIWRDRLRPSGFCVGIVWQGNPDYKSDRSRSVPLGCFAPLANIPGVRLISLQKVHGLGQLESLPDHIKVETLGANFDEGNDAFVDTAAVLMNLDLVITVDTAIGHVAGALGRPVWLLLSIAPHWPWLLEREDTPWYPKTRLFRQRQAGSWTEVFEQMAHRLRGVVRDSAAVIWPVVEGGDGAIAESNSTQG